MKTITNEIAVIGVLFILSVAAGNATAATAISAYQPIAADTDPQYHGGDSHHAITFTGDAHDYVFVNGSSTFTEYDDGTAVLTGRAISADAPDRGFDVNILLQGRTDSAPDGSPKKELLAGAYLEAGGPIDTSSWYYYTSFAGNFVGIGELDGMLLSITQRGPAFQFGMGANNKNIEFGGSGWFFAEYQDGSMTQGDFNMNLQVVPVPAAVQLMLSALAALGFAARRRKTG